MNLWLLLYIIYFPQNTHFLGTEKSMWRWPRSSNRPIPFSGPGDIEALPFRSIISDEFQHDTPGCRWSICWKKYGWYRAFQLRLFDRNMGTLPWVKILWEFNGSYSCTKVTALEKQMALSKFEPCHKFRKTWMKLTKPFWEPKDKP